MTESDLEGSIRIESQPPGATVFVDGEKLTSVTPAKTVIPAGTYHLKFELDGYEPEETNVKVTSNEVTNVSVQLQIIPSHSKYGKNGSLIKSLKKHTILYAIVLLLLILLFFILVMRSLPYPPNVIKKKLSEADELLKLATE
jgi:hypothetical protein